MTLPFMEPLHILGSGSIGLFWAASIRSAFPSYPVAALFRSHHKKMKVAEGAKARKDITVCMMQNNGRPRWANVPCQYIGGDVDVGTNISRRPIRNLILSTKAFQARDAVEGILHRLDRNNLKIMVLSNGALDVRDHLYDVFTAARNQSHKMPEIIMCMTTHGVYQETGDDDEMLFLNHVGKGRTFFGGRHTEIAALWDRSGLNVKTVTPENMEIMLWQKLAANCVCNPLTALCGVSNGELSMNPSFYNVRKSTVEEISQVAQAINPTLADGVSFEALDGFVEQVIQDNLENKSSMYRDIQSKKRNEIDNLNGYIVRKGEQLGIATPSNEELLQRIRDISCIFDNGI